MPDSASRTKPSDDIREAIPSLADTMSAGPVSPIRAGGRDEASILRRMAAGDERAMAELVALHGRGLRAFAHRYLGNAADAEEIVQDVFFKAWRHAGRYDCGTAKVSTWLYRIAVNRCIDRKRASALRAFVGLGNRAETTASTAPDPLRHAEGRDALDRARAAISALPDRQRTAILLIVAGGLDNAGAAGAMQISLGAVEQLLVRARRTLRDELDAMPATGQGRIDPTGAR